MINQIIQQLTKIIMDLKLSVKDDIEDVKKANHEKLLERNDKKVILMDEIVT